MLGQRVTAEGAMGDYVIGGIQQIGVGVPDAAEGFRWARQQLGIDIRVFEDRGVADRMLPYTGGRPRERHALLAVSLQGGGGLEIWQFTERRPESAGFAVQVGDLGVLCPRIKARDIPRAFEQLTRRGAVVLGPPGCGPAEELSFFIRDPFGNLYQIVEAQEWFARGRFPTGGVAGCQIGVSSVEKALPLYSNLLGYDLVLSDESGVFADLQGLPGAEQRLRRVLLGHRQPRQGPFSPLLGPSRLELVQALERAPRKIFADRLWGDAGFIHLCFDVQGMEALKQACAAAGHPFTVDSGEGFDMGDSGGRFAYIEDADGTLIEFSEAHRLAVMKKWGWYLDLRRRDPRRPLPRWMLKSLALNRVRD
jgi:catechol 2,3-dioxygenase-like lactoylglutathione lyase family enzyme